MLFLALIFLFILFLFLRLIQIINLENEITNAENSLKNIVLPSRKKIIQEEIKDKQKKILSLTAKRAELIGWTAEYFAGKRSNEECIRSLIYKDEQLTSLMYSSDEFDEQEDSLLGRVIEINGFNNKKFEDENLQKLVLTSEFSLYLPHTINPKDFFGKPISSLSIYQLKLCAYGSLFDRIFKNVPDIPPNIRKDPAALLQFAENKNESSKNTFKKNEKGGATAVFGATKEDLEIIDPEAKKVNLSKVIKDKGGLLTMEEMMKMMD